MKKLHLRRNLVVIEDGDTIYIQPQKHANIWDKNHSEDVKRAGSVFVIQGNKVIKHLFDIERLRENLFKDLPKEESE